LDTHINYCILEIFYALIGVKIKKIDCSLNQFDIGFLVLFQVRLSCLEHLESSEAKEMVGEARQRLQQLGVSEALLAESVDKGSKSSITGCYRLVLHRIERDKDKLDVVDERCCLSKSPTPSRSTVSSKGGAVRPKKKGRLSTTCVIF
jgi:hypothetical protein